MFRENTINVTYRKNKNLEDLIASSLLSKVIKESNSSIEKFSRRCDIS